MGTETARLGRALACSQTVGGRFASRCTHLAHADKSQRNIYELGSNRVMKYLAFAGEL